jgi:hypothetical protein
MAANKPGPRRVEVRTPNVPGYTGRVDAVKYEATRKALLKIMPRKGAGITQTEMMAKVKAQLPQALFPKGAKSEWWTKCVQLDLEARKVLARDTDAKPLRWLRIK